MHNITPKVKHKIQNTNKNHKKALMSSFNQIYHVYVRQYDDMITAFLECIT